jgi:uncharacterized protein (TIGR02284 family)
MAAKEHEPSGTQEGGQASTHPLAAGVGAAAGAAAGTVAGVLGGPLGMAAGGLAGAVLGASAASAAAARLPGAGELAAVVGSVQSAGAPTGTSADVVETLRDLVECCKDGEYGFRTCAARLQREDLRQLLLQRAQDCQAAADELNAVMAQFGGTPEDGGSALGAMHRGWVSVRAPLSANPERAVLEECERGEDNAQARYRGALAKPLPDAVRALLERHLQAMERTHAQVRAARDAQ